jgi:hypothetical protein
VIHARRARFKGPPPQLTILPPATPPPARLIPLVDTDKARELRMRAVLEQLGIQTQAHCLRCDRPQPFTGLNNAGLCMACSLMREAEQVPVQNCICLRAGTVLDESERICRDQRIALRRRLAMACGCHDTVSDRATGACGVIEYLWEDDAGVMWAGLGDEHGVTEVPAARLVLRTDSPGNDPTLERLTRDTEPLLSGERDTRDTDRPPADQEHVDWAE